eukprot:gnl/TRDRNA2_/TRDRNA2_138210_c0_seq1.p1 gnl/TRDRNA2_/TRDRNA2_138210_c0~~gnl/TRDRNA2_/TRDRNA2_138210_c0_seq1.p1  ORF type:complete len:419 (+),score=63.16 gnl/TRDRNA2_/TRDRNA2_138210_c0_seq1:43-1257(+)
MSHAARDNGLLHPEAWARLYCGANGSAETLRQHLCEAPGRSCEEYSKGSGFCAVSLGLAEKSKTPPAGVLSYGNCGNLGFYDLVDQDPRRTRVLPPALLECPDQVPLALLMVPKSGSMSLIQWLHGEVGQQANAFEAAANLGRRALDRSVGSPEEQRAAFAGHLLNVGDGALSPLSDLGCTAEHAQEVAWHSLAWHQQLNSGWLVLPPYMCPTCCRSGIRRLLVVLARNPFMRLVSYFKKWYLTGKQAIRRWRWEDFGTWILEMAHIARTTDAYTAGRGFNSDFELSDIFHTRSVREMLGDTKLMPPRDLARPFMPLHLETLRNDLKLLQKRLCAEYGYCEKLPRIPEATRGHRSNASMELKEPNRWNALWNASSVRAAVVERYGWDFAHLGYRPDPFASLMPL